MLRLSHTALFPFCAESPSWDVSPTGQHLAMSVMFHDTHPQHYTRESLRIAKVKQCLAGHGMGFLEQVVNSTQRSKKNKSSQAGFPSTVTGHGLSPDASSGQAPSVGASTCQLIAVGHTHGAIFPASRWISRRSQISTLTFSISSPLVSTDVAKPTAQAWNFFLSLTALH